MNQDIFASETDVCDEDLTDIERRMSDVRLKSSSHRVDMSKLPESFLESVGDLLSKRVNDPLALLAFYAHMVSGLHVNEIRERIVLLDGARAKHPSREIVRKKLVAMYAELKNLYTAANGSGVIAPLYPHDTMDSAAGFQDQLQSILSAKEETHGSKDTHAEGNDAAGQSEGGRPQTGSPSGDWE